MSKELESLRLSVRRIAEELGIAEDHIPSDVTQDRGWNRLSALIRDTLAENRFQTYSTYTAVVYCLVDRDPICHNVQKVVAPDVEEAIALALDAEVEFRGVLPVQREGGYKPEHFRVVGIFEGDVQHAYFNFN